MKSGFLAQAMVLALIETAAAQGELPPDPITVTAARTRTLADLGGVTIERARIETTQPATVLDAIDGVSGVRAFAKGGVGGGSFVSIRGGEPNFTTVMIDGIKVNDPTNSSGGAFDFAQIDPMLVERVELFRGGLSAVHGADALAGVINIVPREQAAGARLAGSSAGEAGASAVFSPRWAGGGALIGASAYRSGDLDRGSDIERAQALARIAHQAGGVRLTALGLLATGERAGFPEDGGGPRLAVIRMRERRSTDLVLAGATAALADPGRVAPRLRVAWSRQDAFADTPPIAPGVLDGVPAIVADTRFTRFEAVADVAARLGWATLAAGAAHLDERGTGTGTVDFGEIIPADFALGRSITSGFVEATLAPGTPFTATLSARHDAPTTARARTTLRAAARATPWVGGPSLSGSYSEGFKLPSLFALAYPLIANPALRPERGRSLELALEQPLPVGRARLGVFETRYADLIDFDADTFTNVNRASVVARGVELEAVAAVSRAMTASASLTWLDLDNRDGPPLRSRPELQGNARLEWRASDALSAFVALRHVGRVFDLSVPLGLTRLRAHQTLDAGGSVALTGKLCIDAVLHNFADASIETSAGFPAPDRTLRVALRWAP